MAVGRVAADATNRPRPFVSRRLGWKIAVHALLVPFLIFALFPFYHMTLTSLKQDRELYDRHAVPLVITQGPTVEHYAKLLWDTAFLTWTKNSLLVTLLATTLSLVIGTVAAYALARLNFFGVASFGTGIFVTYLVPTSLLFLPLAQVVNWLGLGDSKWALVVTYPTFLVPFCTWLLMGYFRTVPREVEECAMVDGATRIQALWRIVLPIAVPGLVCAALFAFTLSWNEFIYALTFTSSSDEITASVGVTSELIRGDIYFWGSLMAGAVLGSVPIVILYVFFLDYYVSGLTAGALK
jgi:multiple sugar transport system permease protein